MYTRDIGRLECHDHRCVVTIKNISNWYSNYLQNFQQNIIKNFGLKNLVNNKLINFQISGKDDVAYIKMKAARPKKTYSSRRRMFPCKSIGSEH